MGDNTNRVVSVFGTGAEVTLDNLTIQNGNVVDGNGGGLVVGFGSTVTISNSLISGNAATGSYTLTGNGGGIGKLWYVDHHKHHDYR